MGAETGEGVRGVKPTREELREAAENFDWGQIGGRGWNPCFAIMEDRRFCGRAQRWVGHEPGRDHQHVSLAELLDSGLTDGERLKVRQQIAKVRRTADEARAEGYVWVSTDLDDVLAALAPIAEGE